MVYLLHFSIPYPRKPNGVQHYVGFTSQTMRNRLGYHFSGKGSKYIFAVYKSGRTIVVSRKWKLGDRGLERRIKQRHGSASDLCPICSGRRAYRLQRN